MSEPASTSSGIAERYATAIFELARDQNAFDGIRSDMDALSAALSDSEAFRDMVHSPTYSREEKVQAVGALAERMELSSIMTNALKVMAGKRRLFVLRPMIAQLRQMIARDRDEVTADVIAAKPLSDDQRNRMAETLKQAVGRDVNINLSVDESLIGGLVVQIGSKMIDTSIRSKLNALQNTMREVG